MNNMSFTEEDKQKIIDYMNMIAAHAEFTMKSEDLIKYFQLLVHLRKTILPKIDANILEVKKIIEAEKVVEPTVSEETKE